MARFKIKVENSKDPRKKTQLLEILSINNIYVVKIITVPDEFVILIDSDSELDKVFDDIIDKALEDNGFRAQIPSQLKANRSIIALRVDNHIYQNTEEDIIEEICNKNAWVENISQVLKFPNSNTLKITFDETSIALTAREAGLLLFSMRIPKHDIQQHKFYNILTCP